MKYKRLTKEQFEELHQEFSNFLASQSIDKNQWDVIKLNNPKVAEQELDVFSDLIWEKVLTNAQYLEHFSKNHVFLFHCKENIMQTLVIKSLNSTIDFLTNDGLQWLSDNLFTDNVDIFTGEKQYDANRNTAIFNLILEGAILSDGNIYLQISNIMNQ